MKKLAKTALLGSLIAGTVACSQQPASEKPFETKSLDKGYQNGEQATKDAEGKCGGEQSTATGADGKAAEGKCGEGKCGGDKAAAAGTDSKAAEGKCGEGKCGGKADANAPASSTTDANAPADSAKTEQSK